MFPYFILLFFILIPELYPELKSKRYRLFVIVLSCIFLCFGYMTGSDWRAYEEMYNSINTNFPLINIECEYGYHFYMLIFKIANFDFWHFFIFTKIVIFLLTIHFIYNLCPKYFFLILFFYISFYGFALFIDNPMRTLIASTFFLYGFKYIKKKEFIKYFVFVILASSFHITSIILIFLYWFINRNYKSSTLVIIYIILNVLLWSLDSSIKKALLFSTGIEYIDTRIGFYFFEGSAGNIYAENKIISLGLIVRFIVFYFFIRSRRLLENNYSVQFYNVFFLSFILHRIGISIPIFGRYDLFVCVFYSTMIVFIINAFKNQSKIIYLCFILFISFYTTFKEITFDYKYIPYSNYIEYIFSKSKPSYEERYMHNFNKSPYTKNKYIN